MNDGKTGYLVVGICLLVTISSIFGSIPFWAAKSLDAGSH